MEILLAALSVLLLLCVFGMNIVNTLRPSKSIIAEPFSVETQTATGTRIKAVLDPMVSQGESLCSLFNTIRSNMLKNEKAGQNISDAEAKVRVEKQLSLEIPGGPLSCPLLRYPAGTPSDMEWLNWLQQVPPDFGARIVFMAVYAKDMLGKTESNLKGALLGKGVPTTEPFAPICPPDVAATRRAERARKSEQACDLPEDVGPERIQEQITKLLETLVAQKAKLLRDKGIDPAIDIAPVLKQAKQSQDYLDKQGKAAESGNLDVAIPSMD